jgi:hypothetical protein
MSPLLPNVQVFGGEDPNSSALRAVSGVIE